MKKKATKPVILMKLELDGEMSVKRIKEYLKGILEGQALNWIDDATAKDVMIKKVIVRSVGFD